MNEFAPYAMQAPPFKRRTRQRFIEFDYSLLESIKLIQNGSASLA